MLNTQWTSQPFRWRYINLQHALLLCLCVCLPGQSSFSASSQNNNIDKIKVAYLVNFIRFTTWPDNGSQPDNTPLVITLVDSSNFSQLLTQAFPEGLFGKRPVKLQTLRALVIEQGNLADEQKMILQSSHVIYLRNGSLSDLAAIKPLESKPGYLLVGDMKGFAENGGMIGFLENAASVTFAVNIRAIRESRIQVSSKVLRLGVPVRK
jgi:hypothetical protein